MRESRAMAACLAGPYTRVQLVSCPRNFVSPEFPCPRNFRNLCRRNLCRVPGICVPGIFRCPRNFPAGIFLVSPEFSCVPGIFLLTACFPPHRRSLDGPGRCPYAEDLAVPRPHLNAGHRAHLCAPQPIIHEGRRRGVEFLKEEAKEEHDCVAVQ
jgi:hypothetical protein